MIAFTAEMIANTTPPSIAKIPPMIAKTKTKPITPGVILVKNDPRSVPTCGSWPVVSVKVVFAICMFMR